MAKFEVPDGTTVQAFRFTLDPTEDQSRSLARHFGARRKAFNWAVAALKADIEAWRASGVESEKPSLQALRKCWNTGKDQVCVNADTGAPWWQECSRRPTPTASRVRWMPIGTGRVPARVNVLVSVWVSRGSRKTVVTPIGSVSPPGRCESNPTAGM